MNSNWVVSCQCQGNSTHYCSAHTYHATRFYSIENYASVAAPWTSWPNTCPEGFRHGPGRHFCGLLRRHWSTFELGIDTGNPKLGRLHQISTDTSSGTPDAGGIRSRPGEISGLLGALVLHETTAQSEAPWCNVRVRQLGGRYHDYNRAATSSSPARPTTRSNVGTSFDM